MRKDILQGTGAFHDGLIFNVNRSANVAAATEVPFILLKNPSSSGRTLRNLIVEINFTTSTVFTITAYIDPTISNNGTSLNVRSHLVKPNPPSSVINAFHSPTVDPKGILGKSVAISNQKGILDLSRSLILFPGKDLLLTAQHVALGNQGLNLFPEWMEVS